MRSRMLLALVTATAVAAPLSAMAHHSIANIYDRDKSVTVEGRLTKVELINPHSMLLVEVQGPGETKTYWTLESRAALGMERAGFTKETVALGERITAVGFPAQSGEPSLWLQSLMTGSGKSFSFVRRP